MSEPRKIYVAESGEYSDYHVICAFETREDAETASVGDDVKEMILYPPGVQPVETHLGWVLGADVRTDGDVREARPHHVVHHDWEVDVAPHPMPERPEVVVRDLTDRVSWNCWSISVKGRDFEAVRKALTDRIAHIRAEVLGL